MHSNLNFFFLMLHCNGKDSSTTGKKFITKLLSLGQKRNRDLSNITQPWVKNLNLKKQTNPTNPCSEMCWMELLCTALLFHESLKPGGRFHFLGETLELPGWLSMEEISLGTVNVSPWRTDQRNVCREGFV